MFLQRPAQESHLNAGHLGLSGLQLRGHAMFSDEGLPIDSITLEYAWLIEVQVGVISGKLTPPQVRDPLNTGHLGCLDLSGLQLRGHAMFSDEGLPVDSITLEYA